MRNILLIAALATGFAHSPQTANAEPADHDANISISDKGEKMDWADMFRLSEPVSAPYRDRYARQPTVSEEKKVRSIVSRSSTIVDPARNRRIPVLMYIPQTNGYSSPVIILSNGLGCSNTSCEYLMQTWANNGFCVVSIAHPGSDDKVTHNRIGRLASLRESYQNNSSARARTLDIITVLKYLELQHTDNKNFSGFDLDRVGVAGVDLGALSAMLTAGQTPPDGGPSLADSKITAILPISPPVQIKHGHESTYAGIEVPALYITGTRDNGIVGNTRANERGIPFRHSTSDDRYLLTLNGAGHLAFADRDVPQFGNRNNNFHRVTMARISTVFWKAYLDDDATSLDYMRSGGSVKSLGNSGWLEKPSK